MGQTQAFTFTVSTGLFFLKTFGAFVHCVGCV
jgi:hypothetical protein